MGTLNLTAFEKALGQLATSCEYLSSELAANDPGLRAQFRAAAIQAFEYCFELSLEMIKRQLALSLDSTDRLTRMTYKDLIRAAYDAGLVRDARAFFDYREIRNITSHSYDEDKAEQVIAILDDFRADTDYLLAALSRHHARD